MICLEILQDIGWKYKKYVACMVTQKGYKYVIIDPRVNKKYVI